MATQNDYHFGTQGVVLVGATVLNNVTKVAVAWGKEQPSSKRFSSGDTRAKTVRGASTITCTVTIDLYDETGVVGTLNQFAIGDPDTGITKALGIRPDGPQVGKKELILDPTTPYFGMDLDSVTWDGTAAEEFPAVTGQMVWSGEFPEQVLWTAIPV